MNKTISPVTKAVYVPELSFVTAPQPEYYSKIVLHAMIIA
jgi:hypothetical protein